MCFLLLSWKSSTKNVSPLWMPNVFLFCFVFLISKSPHFLIDFASFSSPPMPCLSISSSIGCYVMWVSLNQIHKLIFFTLKPITCCLSIPTLPMLLSRLLFPFHLLFWVNKVSNSPKLFFVNSREKNNNNNNSHLLIKCCFV